MDSKKERSVSAAEQHARSVEEEAFDGKLKVIARHKPKDVLDPGEKP